MPSKMWDELTYPFHNLNSAIVEVSERKSNIITYFIIYEGCNYLSLLGLNLLYAHKRSPCWSRVHVSVDWIRIISDNDLKKFEKKIQNCLASKMYLKMQSDDWWYFDANLSVRHNAVTDWRLQAFSDAILNETMLFWLKCHHTLLSMI